MLPCGPTCEKSPPGRGKDREALGWVVTNGDPPRRLRRHPSEEGIP